MSTAPQYPTTDWVMLSRTCGDARLDSREALHTSIARYLPCIRTCLQMDRRVWPQDVDDLSQAFIADQVFGRKLFSKADRTRGRFRHLLAVALYRFVVDQGRALSPDSAMNGRTRAIGDDAGGLSDFSTDPGETLGIVWARQTLTLCLAQTRAHYERAGMLRNWKAFERRLLAPASDGAERPSFKQIVLELGFATPSQASNAVISVRRYFHKRLEAALTAQSATGSNYRDELADMMNIFSRSAGSRRLPRID